MPPSFIILMAEILFLLKVRLYLYFFFCLFVLFAHHVKMYAQNKSFYNYNIYNGLPSNFVYQAIVDTNGYLWLATTKGVIKYNGYSFKRFGIEDGLGNEDVWQLVEDDYNRIWLGSISSTFGYIKNDKYVAVITDSNLQLKPFFLQRITGGVSFIDKNLINNSTIASDVMNYLTDNKKVQKVVFHVDKSRLYNYSIGSDGTLRIMKGGGIYKVVSKDRKVVNVLESKINMPYVYEDSAQRTSFSNSDYFIGYHSDNDILYFVHAKSGVLTKYAEKLGAYEKILTVAKYNGKQIITTNRRITVLDSTLRLVRKYYLKDLLPIVDSADAALVWYLDNKLWAGITTTSNSGIYLHSSSNVFTKYPYENLKDAQYVGRGAKGSQFWWNSNTHELIVLDLSGKIYRKVHNEFRRVTAVRTLKGKTFICSYYGLCLFDEKTFTLTLAYKNIKALYSPEWGGGSVVDPVALDAVRHFDARDILHFINDSMYILANTRTLRWNTIINDTFRTNNLAPVISDKYAIDSVYNILYAAISGRLVLHNIINSRRDSVSVAGLMQLGIGALSDVKYDGVSGSLFLQSKDHIFIFNTRKRIFKKVECRFNLSACRMQLYKDNLVFAGSYGIVMYKTYSDGSISKPYYKINYKYKDYKFLYGDLFHVSDKGVTINTDKGMLYADIPSDSVFALNNTSPEFRLLYNYKGESKLLYTGDTIFIDSKDPVLLLDIINPSGVGQPKFYYNTELRTDSWVALNSFEWYVSGLLPGEYNKVYLKVADEGWSSSAIPVWVYVRPYWWQTTFGKTIIGFALLVMVGGIILLAMYITRRQVNKLNAQKNIQAELKSLRTSMELKSIHAQINPHFIFNTLSTGLYYIKKNRMDDAYDHISAFSELLRNYIKSSRDKYITLNEEIDNLKRYVTLQQSRFENLHEFDVEIGDGVNVFTEKIPALLLQPLVENAINHGLFHKQTLGRLLLQFQKRASGELVCLVDDNGVGRERSKAINAETLHKTQSYGTDLVKELVETFNKYEPIHITIEYVDKVVPEIGTTVILTIKREQNDKLEV